MGRSECYSDAIIMIVRTLLISAILSALLMPSCRCNRGGESPEVQIGKGVWQVELAADAASRQRGLSGREKLPSGKGMLFIFPRSEVQTFWMLNCTFPIDVAFISDDMKVVSMYTMEVEADPHHPERVYSSKYPVRFALEVSAGELKRAGVKVGDKVIFRNIRF